MTLMLCLNDVPPDVSADMMGDVEARHAVPLRLPRQQQHNSAPMEAQLVTLLLEVGTTGSGFTTIDSLLLIAYTETSDDMIFSQE